MSHKCPSPACGTVVSDSLLACRSCWYQIPKNIRDAVWRTWRRGAGKGSAEHDKAIRSAIDYLKQQG